MRNYPVVYCLNGFRWLWRYTITSIRGLQKFGWGKEEIHVFYAPPRFPQHIEWLQKNSTLHLVETPLHSPADQAKRRIHQDKFYGSTMKIHAFKMPTDGIFWLDSDSEVFGDFRDMLELDYDILVGLAPKRWGWVMKKPSVHAGFPETDYLYFPAFWSTKNKTHQKLLDYYLYYWEEAFRNAIPMAGHNRLELYAFNLAVLRFQVEDGGNVVVMPPNWQGYEGVTYVCHLRRGQFSPREKWWLTDEDLNIRDIGDKENRWLSM
jgi:hypothetical protein